MKAEQSLPSPTASQAIVLEFAVRYRVVTASALRVHWSDISEQAIEKALKRLKRAGWLHQIQLPQRKSCYALSRQAVRALGISKKAKKHLGPGSVLVNLAMLCFCAKEQVERLTADEVRGAFGEPLKPGLQLANYFTDSRSDPPRLTWMLVDRGSAPRLLVRKADQVVKKAYRSPPLMQLVQGNQFAIVILVPNERKKWLVECVLHQRYFATVAVRVEVVSEIEPLLLA